MHIRNDVYVALSRFDSLSEDNVLPLKIELEELCTSLANLLAYPYGPALFMVVEVMQDHISGLCVIHSVKKAVDMLCNAVGLQPNSIEMNFNNSHILKPIDLMLNNMVRDEPITYAKAIGSYAHILKEKTISEFSDALYNRGEQLNLPEWIAKVKTALGFEVQIDNTPLYVEEFEDIEFFCTENKIPIKDFNRPVLVDTRANAVWMEIAAKCPNFDVATMLSFKESDTT